MSWSDDLTNNVIKLGQSIGLCDKTEIRKLKEQNEKSKLEAEIKAREDESIKQQGKTIKEFDELMPSYNAVVLYATLKTGDLNALKEFLKPKAKGKTAPNADTATDTNVEVQKDDDAEGLAG